MGWRRAEHGWHMSSMRAGQNFRWETINARLINNTGARMFGIGITTLSIRACSGEYQSAANLIAIVMAGEDRGKGTYILSDLNASNLHLCFIQFGKIQSCEKEWVWGRSDVGGWYRFEPEATLWWCNSLTETSNNPCGVTTGQGSSAFGDFLAAARVRYCVMPRPRQCMLSRRGSGRGTPSRPPANSGSLGIHSHHRGTERILTPSNYLDPNSPDSANSSSFGSATFSFNCSLTHPRIMAHVSVLFIEEAQHEGESSTPIPHSQEVHNTSSPKPTSEMQKEQPQPASAISSMMEAHVQPDMQELEMGWCRIVEEEPDE